MAGLVCGGRSATAARLQRPGGRLRRRGGSGAMPTVLAGRRFEAGDLEVSRLLGEGSFGQVYAGVLTHRGGKQRHVVLKRARRAVTGAEEMQEVELLMNERVRRDARGACAEFLGHARVEETTGLLTPGLWLVWAYEGSRTLYSYLQQRDFPAGLVRDLDAPDGGSCPELVVAQEVMRQVLTSLRSVHAAGLVHRDVKPLNLVLSEADGRLKLIDLGACADLRNGLNFDPDETILDPNYAPPEQYVMPSEEAPDLAAAPAPIALVMGTAGWVSHQPDRFDVYSAGIIMLQLCLPSLRTDRGLRAFNNTMRRYDYDFARWRRTAASQFRPQITRALDLDDGAGWDLVEALLRQRPSSTLDALLKRQGRPSADEALSHRWFRVRAPAPEQADAPAPRPRRGAARAAAAKRAPVPTPPDEPAWMLPFMRLKALRAAVLVQETTVKRATTKVERLRKEEGVSKEELAREEAFLTRAQVGLRSLLNELVAAFTGARAAGTPRELMLDDALGTAAPDAGSVVDDAQPAAPSDAAGERAPGGPQLVPAAVAGAVDGVTKFWGSAMAIGGFAGRVVTDVVSAAKDDIQAAIKEAEDSLAAEGAAPPGAAVERASALAGPRADAADAVRSTGREGAAPRPAPPAGAAERVEALQSEMSEVMTRIRELEQQLAEQRELVADLQRAEDKAAVPGDGVGVAVADGPPDKADDSAARDTTLELGTAVETERGAAGEEPTAGGADLSVPLASAPPSGRAPSPAGAAAMPAASGVTSRSVAELERLARVQDAQRWVSSWKVQRIIERVREHQEQREAVSKARTPVPPAVRPAAESRALDPQAFEPDADAEVQDGIMLSTGEKLPLPTSSPLEEQQQPDSFRGERWQV